VPEREAALGDARLRRSLKWVAAAIEDARDPAIRAIGLSVRRSEQDARVLVPVLIFAAAFSIGIVASSRWIPDLAAGPVGGLAFFVVCGLIGAATGVLAMHIYMIVEELEQLGGHEQRGIVANGIRNIMFDVGSLTALASIVYLLAPEPLDVDDEPLVEPAT
jgi:hypothetical protein